MLNCIEYLSTAIVMAGLASLPRLGLAFRRLLARPQKEADRITGLNSHCVWSNDGSLLFLHFGVAAQWGGISAQGPKRMTRRRGGMGKTL